MSSVLDRLVSPGGALQRRLGFATKRFVAGETIPSALEAVRALNDSGRTATLDFLGEDVASADDANATRDTYLAMAEAIAREGLRTNVSVKLTALGLTFDEDRCARLLGEIAAGAAVAPDPFVRVDMEGSAVTEATLRVVRRVRTTHPNVGPVLQAYLRRTPADVERSIALGERVRLCKGAYAEPSEVALQAMPRIRTAYLRAAESLLTRGVYPGIATHDDRLIDAVRRFTTAHGIAPDRFEFQLLYGVRPTLQRTLVADGYAVRVYVPFGTHWAGYMRRRIAERPANAVFALRSLVRS